MEVLGADKTRAWAFLALAHRGPGELFTTRKVFANVVQQKDCLWSAGKETLFIVLVVRDASWKRVILLGTGVAVIEFHRPFLWLDKLEVNIVLCHPPFPSLTSPFPLQPYKGTRVVPRPTLRHAGPPQPRKESCGCLILLPGVASTLGVWETDCLLLHQVPEQRRGKLSEFAR